MSGNIQPGTRVRPANGVYARPFGDELVLLEFGRGEYFALDPIGAAVWRRCEAGESVAAIADALAAEFEVTPGDALRDTLALVAELLDSALLTLVEPVDGAADATLSPSSA